jgi:hypothetical protein
MAHSKPNPIVHLLPSLTDVAFLMPLLFMFTKLDGARALLGDGDTGWHIRTGEWILANHRVPRTDLFSFTKPGQPWFAWEWLTDVIFGWLHQHWGLAGVVALGMLILCLTSALLFRLIRRRCSNPFIAIGFTYLAVASSSIHWHARPHLFTLLFVVIFLHILDRVRDGRTRLLFLLPVLTVPWTNLHGGFFVGIVLLGLYAAGEVLTWFLEPDQVAGRAALVRALRYATAAAGCAVASLANPYTYHLHVFIAQYLGSPFLNNISEFMSPNFRSAGTLNFEILLLASMALVGWSLARRRYADALIVAAWAHLALFSARNIPLFAFVAAAAAARSLQEVLDTLSRGPIAGRAKRILNSFDLAARDIGEVDASWRVHAVSALVLVLLVMAISNRPAAQKLQASFDPERFPVHVVPVLERMGTGKLFTTDQWGDYLIYRLYPNMRVYIDGRSDFYGNDFVNDYGKVLTADWSWTGILDRQGVTAVLLRADEGFAGVLKASPAWKVVYDDHKAILFRKSMRSSTEQASSAEGGRLATNRSCAGCDPKVTATNNCDLRIALQKPL